MLLLLAIPRLHANSFKKRIDWLVFSFFNNFSSSSLIPPKCFPFGITPGSYLVGLKPIFLRWHCTTDRKICQDHY